MNDCSKCKFSEEDYIFDEEIGEECVEMSGKVLCINEENKK